MRQVSTASVSAVTIEPGASPVTEGTAVQFTVQATPAPADDLLVSIQVTDAGTRLAASPPPAVTVPAGATATTLRLETDADEEEEADSTVTAMVTEGTGYTLGTPSSARVTVTDAEAPVPVVTIAAASSSVSEGAAVVFTVMAAPAPAVDLEVSVAVTETEAMLQESGPRTVTILAGATEAMLAVATAADEEDEPDSTVTAMVTEGSGYTLGTGMSSASVLVTDADEPLPVVTIMAAASEVTEGTPVQFTVSADRTLGVGLPVNVSVRENHSMLAGSPPRSVTIRAGAGAATLTANTDDDSAEERASTVTAEVAAGTGYEIGVPSSAAVRVVDNDGTPPGMPETGGLPGPLPLFFNFAVEPGTDLVINGKNDVTVGTIGQCAEIGMSTIPRKYWVIGGVPAISYDIWLEATVEDDASTADVDESATIMIGPDHEMTAPYPPGMASLAAGTAVVNGMHSYKVMADDDNLVVSGIADVKTTTAASLAVNLRASDSHDPQQRAERGLMRNINITRHAIDHAVQGTTGLDESIHDDTAFTSEQTYSADDFPNRPGAPDEFLTLGFPTDAMAHAVTGKIQGALDEDWFLFRGIAPDYLIHLEIVGSATFCSDPSASS